MWITGTVVRGDGRGKSLGFPTANIVLAQDQAHLEPGVYAVEVRIPNDAADPHAVWAGAMHVGPRPTFPGASASIEIHILDFPERDLYDQTLSFSVVEKIRDVEKFDDISALIAAIDQDCDQVRMILKSK